MLVYLCGSAEFGGDKGKLWRHKLAPFLRDKLGHRVYDPAEDDKKNRWLFLPALGAAASGVKFPITNGEAPNGSIMAFRVEDKGGKAVVTPAWISRDM